MNAIAKTVMLLLISALAASVLVVTAQASRPAPEFTLAYVSYPYTVEPTSTTTVDPYTGKTTTVTQPSYSGVNKKLEATITNPAGATYYNFRIRGHYGDSEWKYFPFSPKSNYMLADGFGVPYQASNTTTTVLALEFYELSQVPVGGEVDIQVQALFGGFRAVPYGHVIDVGGPTYDFYFEGEAGPWSSTITITIEGSSIETAITPQPTLMPTQVPTEVVTDNSAATPTSHPGDGTQATTFEAIIIALLAFIVALVLWIALKLPKGGSRHV